MNLLKGVNVAAVTPRRESGHEIDLGLTLEIVDFLCAAGVAGIGLLGTTGEFVHYDFEQRTRLAGLIVRRSRVPVVVNVTHTTLDGSVRLAREAMTAGAAGVLIMPPYFFRYGQDDLEAFFLEFAVEAGNGVPVYIYNLPFFTSPLECETVCRLLATGQFAGIKDSSGSLDYFRGLMAQRARTPFVLLIGNDTLFVQGRGSGADGGVSGVACALPELMLGLDRAIAERNQPRVELLEGRLNEFISWLDRFPVPVGIKAALAARGLRVGPHAVPTGPQGRKRLDEYSIWLKEWIPQVLRESKNAK